MVNRKRGDHCLSLTPFIFITITLKTIYLFFLSSICFFFLPHPFFWMASHLSFRKKCSLWIFLSFHSFKKGSIPWTCPASSSSPGLRYVRIKNGDRTFNSATDGRLFTRKRSNSTTWKSAPGMSWMPKEKTSWSGRERERKGNPGEDKDKVKQGKEEL